MSEQLKIAIASGKGGTGKTTFAVNLFKSISENFKSILIDCDVEEPNAKLFFNCNEPEISDVTIKIPRIKTSKCEYCGRCVNYCAYNAILYIKDLSFLKIMEDLCHGCGGCLLACHKNAIEEKDKLLGKINSFKISANKTVVEGNLEIGVATPVPVIKAAKKKGINSEIIIYDAPPGTSCPAVETVADADYVILVAEPTPFGLNDLKLSIEAFSNLNKKMGIVINKSGIGNFEIYDYLKSENLEILAEIPFNKEFAKVISDGSLLIDVFPEYQKIFDDVFLKIKNQVK